MAAELRDGEVQRSWIWQPQHGTAYVAERGLGAWRNGERLTRPPVGDVLRGVTSRRRWIGRSLDGLPPLELTWVCCGVDYPKLVEGAADYLLYSGTRPWDHAPAPCSSRRQAPSWERSRAGATGLRTTPREGWLPQPTMQHMNWCRGAWATWPDRRWPTLGRGGRGAAGEPAPPHRDDGTTAMRGQGPGLAPGSVKGLGRGAGSATQWERRLLPATRRPSPGAPAPGPPSPVPREQAQTQTYPPTAARASAGRPTRSSTSRSRRTPPGGAPHGRGPRRGGRPRRRGR